MADSDAVQLLTRRAQVGEFYVMSPPQVDPDTNGGTPHHTCDLLIYDEESDRHVRITWYNALKAMCTIATAHGHPAPGGGGAPPAGAFLAGDLAAADAIQMNGGDTLKMWYNAAVKWASYSEQRDFPNAAGGAELRGLNNAKDDFADLAIPTWAQCQADGGARCRIILTRPFIEHMMHSCVMTVAGRDTGATLFGPADMQLAANVQVKTIEGHCERLVRSNERSSMRRSRTVRRFAQTQDTSRRWSPSRRTCS